MCFYLKAINTINALSRGWAEMGLMTSNVKMVK